MVVAGQLLVFLDGDPWRVDQRRHQPAIDANRDEIRLKQPITVRVHGRLVSTRPVRKKVRGHVEAKLRRDDAAIRSNPEQPVRRVIS